VPCNNNNSRHDVPRGAHFSKTFRLTVIVDVDEFASRVFYQRTFAKRYFAVVLKQAQNRLSPGKSYETVINTHEHC
jgi:hypothetical protein